MAQAPLQLIVDLDVKELATYLNDHLAGSIAAIELLDHLIKTYHGKPLAKFFQGCAATLRQIRIRCAHC